MNNERPIIIWKGPAVARIGTLRSDDVDDNGNKINRFN